ncbi:MAG: hypothetical protein M3Q07_27930 [Pseudobdellovibrionaceae bacterium]|nr:hypothetical protein [Pseudobdellovibrionaceae bacterium]
MLRVYGDATRLFVITLSGLWMSADKGASWSVRREYDYENGADVENLLVVDDKIFLSTNQGIEVSVNEGQSWTKLDSRNGFGSIDIQAIIWNNSRIYALSPSGLFQSDVLSSSP